MPPSDSRERTGFGRPAFARGLGVAVALATVLAAGGAAAERVRTTGPTKVYKRTGEQSAVVTRVREGTTLQVIATSGRWLKVRVNGRTGWITRASVLSLSPVLPRNTRRRPFVDGRSMDRDGGGDAPEDRIGADAIDGEDDDGGGDEDDDDRDREDDDRADDPPPRIEVRKPARDERDDRRGRDRARARDDDDDDRRARDRDRARDDDDDDDDRRARDRGDADDRDAGSDAALLLTVRVARAPLYQRPSQSARSVLTLRAGDRLILLEEHRSGDWLRVEVADDDAVSGYVRRDAVGSPGDGVAAGRTLAAAARLGLASIGGTFHSDGAMLAGGPPADYPFGSTAISLAIGGEATFPLRGRLLAGASVRYLGCRATPGISFEGESIGFTTHDVDLLAIGGYDLRHPRAITLWARAGLHFARFSVSDLGNRARIPAETAYGPMLGAAVRVGRLTPTIGLDAAIDVMPTAKRAQTVNQTDGQLAATRTVWLQLAGTYALAPRWRLEGGYQLGYTASRWAGASDRHMSATGATRSDRAHVLGVGVSRPF
jgi:hypothetical protein